MGKFSFPIVTQCISPSNTYTLISNYIKLLQSFYTKNCTPKTARYFKYVDPYLVITQSDQYLMYYKACTFFYIRSIIVFQSIWDIDYICYIPEWGQPALQRLFESVVFLINVFAWFCHKKSLFETTWQVVNRKAMHAFIYICDLKTKIQIHNTTTI